MTHDQKINIAMGLYFSCGLYIIAVLLVCRWLLRS
jgi:hypothetical protein